MTKKEIAEKLGISTDTMINWEKNPAKKEMIRILNLGLMVDEIIKDTNEIALKLNNMQKIANSGKFEIKKTYTEIDEEINKLIKQIEKNKQNKIEEYINKIENQIEEMIKNNELPNYEKLTENEKNFYSNKIAEKILNKI